MVQRTADYLGQGIYTPSEAAFYARIRTQLINSWLYGSVGRQAVIAPERGNENRDVTFLDFVQALAIRAIRKDHRVSLQKIRAAVDFAKGHYKLSHPLATKHTTYLLDRKGESDKRENKPDEESRYELVIDISSADQKQDPELIQLTGRHSGSRMIGEIVELFLEDISFDADGRAQQYYAYRHSTGEVTMNPNRHFGEPLLPSGYTAMAIADAVKIEGSVEAVSRAYGVGSTEVELACRYLDYLQGPSAT